MPVQGIEALRLARLARRSRPGAARTRVVLRLALLAALTLPWSAPSCYGRAKFGDPDYEPSVGESPRYAPGAGPTVLFDDGHGNVHRLSLAAGAPGSGFHPFRKLLEADGYVVQPTTRVDGAWFDLLVVANPMVAFTQEEILWVQAQVAAGAGLLLIADQKNLPLQMNALAAGFGLEYENVFLALPGAPGMAAAVEDHWITAGVGWVPLYTGSMLVEPPLGTVLGRLPPGSQARYSAAEPPVDAEGAPFAVAVDYGAGRVVAISMTELVTAVCRGSCSADRRGFGGVNAEYLEQWTLRIVRWLDGF